MALGQRLGRYLESFIHNQEDPRMSFFPGLRTKPWYDPRSFPIVRALERAHEKISREILALEPSGFHRESERVRRTGNWNVFFLYEPGRKLLGNCSRCPVTARIIENYDPVPQLAGMAYISKMSPGTHIHAHQGPTNLRLRCHLGIRIPEGDCGLRVDKETRRWEKGKCIVFDDSYQHEVWNHTEEPRTVLIVDLWHPGLTRKEVAFLKGLHRFGFFHATNLHDYWAANSRARAASKPEYD